jgi:hypothetical protein
MLTSKNTVMKRLLTATSCLFLLMVLLASCKKDDRDINLNLSEVTTLYAPDDNAFVKLQPATSATVVFEWDQAKAEDGSLVMYEVAFAKEGGDFTQPVYKIASDGSGVQNKLSLSHKDLNRIANFAGIKSLERGKLKWTVVASKGTNMKTATVSRTIEVERPAGFAEIPTDVYLTGEATEGGTDLSKAIKMKQTSSGVFELYTSLNAGTYRFVTATTGTPVSYQVQGEFLKEGDAVASPATAQTPYRITLDFNNASATLQKIKSLGYWFSPEGSIKADLAYSGNSTWTAPNTSIAFKQEGWGRDERYKFQMKLENSDGSEVTEWWGSTNADNSRPDASTPAQYFFLSKVPEGQNDQWNYSFKFPTEADGAQADFLLHFDPDAPYYHEVALQ